MDDIVQLLMVRFKSVIWGHSLVRGGVFVTGGAIVISTQVDQVESLFVKVVLEAGVLLFKFLASFNESSKLEARSEVLLF